MPKLKSTSELESSCIVANNRMNRERVALGTNGYDVEIGFDPIVFLQTRYEQHGAVSWLDLCCGRGKALIEAGMHFASIGMNTNAFFLGVDLVNMFDSVPDSIDFVTLEPTSLHRWETDLKFDLITCVHGIHYIGDKLDLISRSAKWLRPEGHFLCSLDLNNLRSSGDSIDFESLLSQRGFVFDPELHLLSLERTDLQTAQTSIEFLGADDEAGPNYTGQEAVNSYYRFHSPQSV